MSRHLDRAVEGHAEAVAEMENLERQIRALPDSAGPGELGDLRQRFTVTRKQAETWEDEVAKHQAIEESRGRSGRHGAARRHPVRPRRPRLPGRIHLPARPTGATSGSSSSSATSRRATPAPAGPSHPCTSATCGPSCREPPARSPTRYRPGRYPIPASPSRGRGYSPASQSTSRRWTARRWGRSGPQRSGAPCEVGKATRRPRRVRQRARPQVRPERIPGCEGPFRGRGRSTRGRPRTLSRPLPRRR
jgi:hypothetical protein